MEGKVTSGNKMRREGREGKVPHNEFLSTPRRICTCYFRG